jgi:tetratricopeptide (TPR) repeat protein
MSKLITLIVFLIPFHLAVAQNIVGDNLKIAAELFDQKEYESSLFFCNKALDIDPNLPDAYFFRGINNHELENYQDAIVDFTVAVKLKPDFLDAYYYRAKSKKANNDFLGAASDFNKARELSPSQATLFFVKAALSSLFGDSENNKKNKGK